MALLILFSGGRKKTSKNMNGISAISHKAAREAPVIADVVWKSCDWKATFIERECGGGDNSCG